MQWSVGETPILSFVRVYERRASSYDVRLLSFYKF